MESNNYDYREKKIVAVLASNLENGVAMNVLGHLALSVGAYADKSIMGRPLLTDASGRNHLGIAKYPFIVTKVKPGRLRKAIEEARSEGNLLISDFPKQMLETGHDDELDIAIKSIGEENIEYLGAVFYGLTETINKITGKFTLWN